MTPRTASPGTIVRTTIRRAAAVARARVRDVRGSWWGGPIIRRIDRIWWVRTINRAGIVDPVAVSAQRPGLSPRAAVRHYVRRGFREGFVLNPLFSEQMVSMQLSDAGRVPALYAYLVNDRRRIRTSLLWDAPGYALAHPESSDDPAGPLGHAWRSLQAGSTLDFGFPGDRTQMRADRISALVNRALSRSERVSWLSDLAELASVDVVLLWRLSDLERDFSLTMETAAEASRRLGARLVLAVDGERPDAWLPAAAGSAGTTGTLVISDAPRASVVATAARQLTPGSRLIVRGPGDEITTGSVVALSEADTGITSPLVLDVDGVVINGGLVRRGSRLHPLLQGHPAEDARGLGPRVRVDGVASTTFAMTVGDSETPETAQVRTDAWVISPVRHLPAHTRVEAAQGMTDDLDHLVARIDLATVNPDDAQLGRRAPAARSAAPRLRWALKTAAPAGLGAEWWGDTHFARGLADALRRRGQDVVIDSIGARNRPSHHLDDVEVVLRGPERIEPHRSAISLLWIISHPDQLTRDETAAFDHVFAASEKWIRSTAGALGPIEPLLQCTDVHRFHPTGAERTDRIVFVGTARGIPRPSVIEPIRAGFEVDVYGPDWTGWIPASSVVASGVPNADLPALYEGARLVLNDHWPAMQASGFISNRLFDVVAAGGRAISDDVEGIDDLFGGMVRTYRTVPELLGLLRQEPESLFPSREKADRISTQIRQQHSFDARASTLLETALRARTAATPGR
ncbi:glycosyltransferase [Microbacterium sp. NE2HP2]|uniref:glycosyltransferase n=1 Tax=Microbacterium plantarum TaxID=1816425 RepID=UPI0023671438|nr:glycosyltransferase [Microbacterium plantarum]MDD7945101.1 glycosyltransferase [Microbacterium plantarum]